MNPIVADMKRFLLTIAFSSLAGCASMGQKASTVAATSTSLAALLAQLPGEYDNHAQIWQAQQAGNKLLPVHVRQNITRDDQESVWTWQLQMGGRDGEVITARWRYSLRTLENGNLQMIPSRALPAGSADEKARWAELMPCAMQGRAVSGRLQLAADKDACGAIIAGLGSAAALLPLILDFDGKRLITQTYSDVARGPSAHQVGQRVRWYQGWVAINGAGPEAEGDNKDWHMQRDIKLGNQGQGIPIRWRDGTASGYSLKLETLEYQKRNMQVLRLSLIRDQDGASVAYAWADPESRQIGLNLGWVQTGLTRSADKQSASGSR